MIVYVCPRCREDVTEQVIRKQAGRPVAIIAYCSNRHAAKYGGRPELPPRKDAR